MSFFEIIAILLTLSATFSYLNHRYIGLPVTIGVMIIALAMSVVLNLLGYVGIELEGQVRVMLEEDAFLGSEAIDFLDGRQQQLWLV